MNKAIEIWNSLDLNNQADLECARAWFIEGFAHGQESKEYTDDEVKEYYESTYETYAQYEGFVEGVKWASKITKVLNVPVKTLENEEFIKLAEESGFMLVSSHPQDMENALYECFPDQINYFARAILRKAQDK